MGKRGKSKKDKPPANLLKENLGGNKNLNDIEITIKTEIFKIIRLLWIIAYNKLEK